VQYKLCTLVHSCLYGVGPSYLAELVVPTSIASNRAGLRSAQSLSIAVPRTHSTLGDRAFSVAAPRAWNNLPPHIRHISSMDVFSKNLKSFLFHEHSNCCVLECVFCFMFLFSCSAPLLCFCVIYGALIWTSLIDWLIDWLNRPRWSCVRDRQVSEWGIIYRSVLTSWLMPSASVCTGLFVTTSFFLFAVGAYSRSSRGLSMWPLLDRCHTCYFVAILSRNFIARQSCSMQRCMSHTATLSRDKVARQNRAIKSQVWHRS